MSHMKRLNAPRQWNILRKDKKYVVRPFPSGHVRELSLPILVVLRDMLRYVQTAKELRIALQQKNVFVDGKEQGSVRDSIGLLDVLGLPKAKENYRLLLDENGRLQTTPIDLKESGIKICKITGKRRVKGSKTQIGMHDGRTLLDDKLEVSVGDSVLLQLPEGKVSKVLKMKKGAYVYLTGGKHSGSHGTLNEINGDKVVYEDGKNKMETLKKHIIVIGEQKPEITLHNGKHN